MACHVAALGQIGDVVGGVDVLQVAEPSARVERAVAVGRQRVHGAGERVGRVDRPWCWRRRWPGRRRAGSRRTRCPRRPGTLRRRRASGRRPAGWSRSRSPAAVAGVQNGSQLAPSQTARLSASAVAARVLEVATGVDLAAGRRRWRRPRRWDLLRRRADRAPAAAVPLRDAVRVGDPAGVGELAADVERARRHRPARRRRGSASRSRACPGPRGGPSRRGPPPAPTSRARRWPAPRRARTRSSAGRAEPSHQE